MSEILSLTGDVPVQYVLYTVITVVALVIVVIKVFPTWKGWFEEARKRANRQDHIDKTLEEHTKTLDKLVVVIDSIDKNTTANRTRIDKLTRTIADQQNYMDDSIEERELIIRSLLGVVHGLQEIGANGGTKSTEHEIQEFLLKKAHAPVSSEAI